MMVMPLLVPELPPAGHGDGLASCPREGGVGTIRHRSSKLLLPGQLRLLVTLVSVQPKE